MTISSNHAAMIAAHPVYGSVLAALPSDRPIPLTEILAEYAHHSRWNQLTPNTQHRLQQLQRRRG